MKKFNLILILITLIGFVSACSNHQEYPYGVKSTASLEDHYKTLEEITGDSQLIVEVKVKDNPESIEYGHGTFTTNSLYIKDVIKGDGTLLGKEITLLELGDYMKGDLNVVKNNKKYFLFLKQYEGPIVENAYVVTGVYQGKFEVDEKNNQLKYVGDNLGGVNYFQKNYEGYTIEKMKEKILE